MLDAIDIALSRSDDVATRRQLLQHVSRNQFDHEVRRGYLVAVFRSAYARPWNADVVRDRAALLSVGPPAALHGPTALARWGLCEPPATVHVVVPGTRWVRPQAGVTVHRPTVRPSLQHVGGLPTSGVADAVVTSWAILPAEQRRSVAIAAVRERRTTPQSLAAAAGKSARLAARREFTELLRLLGAGCESELEIWGLLRVFDAPGLRHAVRQHEVNAGGRRYRLDLAFLAQRVAVELDGAAHHFGREARERDMRRDAALLAAGWLVVRFSYRRLHDDPDGCRRDLLAVLASRRVVHVG